jgi:SAM-dependent methyltransferase
LRVVALDISLWEMQGLYTSDYFIDGGTSYFERVLGSMNDMPLASESLDYVFACEVLHHNDAEGLRRTFEEAFRVLKPGGRFAVSDVVVRGEVPPDVKKNMELWIGCVAGALEEQEFLALLRDVGFTAPSIEPTRVYKAEDAAAFLKGSGLDPVAVASDIDGKFMGAFVRATKPLACCAPGSECCGPDCC